MEIFQNNCLPQTRATEWNTVKTVMATGYLHWLDIIYRYTRINKNNIVIINLVNLLTPIYDLRLSRHKLDRIYSGPLSTSYYLILPVLDEN
jgi:transposase